ncbi:MAG: cysteine synthase A [Candidatus Amulumruptor caecigallinarius]|nr:MAG: cysteine synthase A [Candidatus Amulumruptor caecigallinarius]
MGEIKKNLAELIGKTPLMEVGNIEKKENLAAKLLVKVESFNPGGSVKDRVALAMIEEAEASGLLKPGATIIEPTSGNTGIGLAWVATVKGYNAVLTMPDTMSVERQNLLKAFGAKIILTPGAEGMKGAIAKAEALRDATEGSVILGQFDNPANPAVHARTTALEIWDDTNGEVNYFVAGVGTGGTVSGTGGALKKFNPGVKVVAVEPEASAVISGEAAGPHKIQGIGAGFIPKNFDRDVVDDVVKVSNDDAMRGARMLASTEGLLCGISSGAAFWAALALARKPENAGKTIVVLLPDTGERYLSTQLFAYDDYPL